MNLDLFKQKLVRNTIENYMSWCQLESGSDSVIMGCNYGLREYDDPIFIKMELTNKGSLFIDFFFDILDNNPTNLKLINRFNCESYFLQARIEKMNRKDRLVVSYAEFSCASEDEAVSALYNCLGQLTNPGIAQSLKALTVLSGKEK